MKKFHFSLQPLLDVASNRKKQNELILYEKEMNLLKMTSELESLLSTKSIILNEMKYKAEYGISASLLKSYMHYINTVDKHIISQNEFISQLNMSIKETKDLLFELLKEIKTLEDLREKEIRKHNYKSLREQELIQEELVTYRITVNGGLYGK